jgi:hypothetical protein
VTDFHGILLNNAIEQTISGWQAKSDKEGFIVVWPNGIDTAWNVGPCCTTSRTVDDVGFARAVVNQIASQACIDKKHIYAVGYSLGLAGSVLYLGAQRGGPVRRDRSGGVRSDGRVEQLALQSVASGSRWSTFAAPATPSSPQRRSDEPANGLPIVVTLPQAVKTFSSCATRSVYGLTCGRLGTGAGCRTYKQCAGGVQVSLCTKQGGGHDVSDPAIVERAQERLCRSP